MWSDLVDNPEFIRQLYAVEPGLENVKIHEVNLHRDGPRLSVRFEIQDFPTNIPKKWSGINFKIVQITLEFWGVAGLKISGFGTSNASRISISRGGQKDILIAVAGNETEFTLSCNMVRIAKIEPFL